jgi:hypothetical protein
MKPRREILREEEESRSGSKALFMGIRSFSGNRHVSCNKSWTQISWNEGEVPSSQMNTHPLEILSDLILESPS